MIHHYIDRISSTPTYSRASFIQLNHEASILRSRGRTLLKIIQWRWIIHKGKGRSTFVSSCLSQFAVDCWVIWSQLCRFSVEELGLIHATQFLMMQSDAGARVCIAGIQFEGLLQSMKTIFNTTFFAVKIRWIFLHSPVQLCLNEIVFKDSDWTASYSGWHTRCTRTIEIAAPASYISQIYWFS